MTLLEFSTHEQTIIQALRVAGHIYAQDATACRKEGQERLADQFDSQSAYVFKIAERIEEEGVSK